MAYELKVISVLRDVKQERRVGVGEGLQDMKMQPALEWALSRWGLLKAEMDDRAISYMRLDHVFRFTRRHLAFDTICF